MEKITDSMKEFFERIRDERTMHANTANRIGNAFLMILNYLLDSDTPYLRKDREDSTRYLLTLLAGAVIGESGRIRLNPDGSIICDSINVEGSAVFNELVFNHQNVLEGDTYFSDRGIVEKVEALSEGRYRIFLRKEYEEASVPFQPFDVLKCSMNNLDAARTFKDSWVRVDSVDLPANSMDVTLYDHDDVPGGTNYVPEPSARITRWGNQKNEKRQDVFFVSGAEGRFLFLQGVTQPKLTDGNYSAFIGLPPELEVLKNLPIDKRQPYIYARGLIVQDIMYVDYMGNPQYTQRDLGTWKEDGVYIHGWDEKAKGWYSDRVWWGGCYWQCSVEKATAGKAPRFNNADWACLMGAHDLSLSVKSAGGDRFPEGEDWNTTLNAELWNAEMQIMENEIPKSAIRWTRNSGNQVADQTWNDNHPAETLGLSLPVSSLQDVGEWNADSNVIFQCDITLDAIGVTVSGTCQLSGFRESTLYTWVKYADSADGAGMSDNPEGKMYIGLAYNKTTPESSNDPLDYSWSLFGGTMGKSAAKAYVTSNDIAIPTDADGIVTEDFQIGNTFSLMVDGKNCTNLKVTSENSLPSDVAFKVTLSGLWLEISSSKGANFGTRAWTLHFTVTGSLDGATYTDVVTILVRPNKAGKDGKNLTKVNNFYKWGSSGTVAPGGDFTMNAIPEHLTGLDYLWNFEVCYNDDGQTISTSTKTCIGYFPKDGAEGRGIVYVAEFYKIGTEGKPTEVITVSTDGKKVTKPTGWQEEMPSLTAEMRYLWNQELIKFTDGTYSVSEVHLAGAQGEKGESVKVIDYLVNYAISSDGKNPPKEFPHTQTPELTTESEPYLWTRTAVFYSDGSKTYSYSVARQGQKGDKGNDGRNLTKITNYYKWGTNGSTAPTGTYTADNYPSRPSGYDYLWGFEVCTDDNGLEISTSNKHIVVYIAKDGAPGSEGKGIASITEFYQVGTADKPKIGITVNSDNKLNTDGWKTTMDATTNEKRYVWNQEVIKFTDGTYSISVIHLAGAQGGDGADAKLLSLRCDRQVINCDDTSSPWDDGNITIEAVLENLSGTVTWTIDWDNANGEEIEDTRYEIRGNVLEITDTYYFTGMCYNIYITAKLGQYSAKTTIAVVNDGTNGRDGINGKPLVGPTEWREDVRYLSGKSNEAYQSIVINPNYPNYMYLCGYSHTNVEPSANTSVSSASSCTWNKPWVQVAYQDFVATKVLFAERGKIENLDIINATIQGTITDMAVTTQKEWDAITNALVPKLDKDKTEVYRNFQIVDPSKAGSYFIPTIDPTSILSDGTVYDRGPQIVFLPTFEPDTTDIITSKTTGTSKKRYNIPKYQTAGTHIRITKGGAPLNYSRWAYLEDAEYERLWTSKNTINRRTICDIYNLGTLICADHKIFRVTDGHNIQGQWYYGDSDYKHGRFSVNGTVARMLWLMPGQSVELVSQIEVINKEKCLVWSVVNASDFTAVNINVDLFKRSKTDTGKSPTEFYGESPILTPPNANLVDNWADCFIAHKKMDNLLLNGETRELPSLFINRNGADEEADYPIAEFYLP